MKTKNIKMSFPNDSIGNPLKGNNIIDHSITIVMVIFTILLFSTLQLIAQEVEKRDPIRTTTQNIKIPNTPQAVNDKIEIKNELGNVIFTIMDEGNNEGSILLTKMVTAPSVIDQKLYNVGGSLMFNGSTLGSTGTINDLSDARAPGNSVFLGSGAGNNDDGSNNKNYGLGINSLFSAISGFSNAAIGFNTLYFNTTGNYNIGIGQGSLYYNNTGGGNVAVGYHSNHHNQAGSNNTILGHQAGRGTTTHDKSGNVFIGYNAGYDETGDEKLYIENSNSSSPLVWGDFANDSVKINGELEIAGKTKTTNFQLTTGAANGYVLKSDANGNGSWQVNSGGGSSDNDWTISGNDMYSAPSGNVGIGTFSPVSKLSVGGGGVSQVAIYGEDADTNGIGIYGYATEELASGGQPGAQAHNYGGYFVANGMNGKGVYGLAPSTMSGHNYGGYFVASGLLGTGVYGESTNINNSAFNDPKYGGYFKATGNLGVGVKGYVVNGGTGVAGESDDGIGVSGISTNGNGIYGNSANSVAGNFISENGSGIVSQSNGDSKYGVQVLSTGDNAFGIRVTTNGSMATGVQSEADGPNGVAFRAFVNNPTATAGWFGGDVTVTGNLSKGGGSFKIDHPLDPENKYLYHSFVESPDMMNIYNGNIILDANGDAVVEMPEWFEALNMEFRYQLTCIGGFSQVYISDEISGNKFKIAGGKAGMKVSWQVTGIRHDKFAIKNRIPVEEMKKDKEQGKYLHPAVFNMPKTAGVDYVERVSKKGREIRNKYKESLEKNSYPN